MGGGLCRGLVYWVGCCFGPFEFDQWAGIGYGLYGCLDRAVGGCVVR